MFISFVFVRYNLLHFYFHLSFNFKVKSSQGREMKKNNNVKEHGGLR